MAVADAIRSAGGEHVTLVLTPVVLPAVGRLASLPVGIVLEPDVAGSPSRPALWRRGPLRMWALARGIRRKRRRVADRLVALRPDVLVVFEDRFIDPEAIWLAEASRLGVPAVLVRYAAASPESDAWTRRGRAAYSLDAGLLAGCRRAFARAHPHHAWDDGQGAQLFYPLWDALALARERMADGRPWVVGGGAVTRVAVQGEADRREAETVSGLHGRFVVTGQASWDDLVAGEPQSGASAPRRPRVVCAWPQWAEHGQLGWSVHLALLERLAAELGKCAAEVVLCLHPKADAGRYEPLAASHGLSVSRLPLQRELRAADIFVASWSSTLRLAAMLGIAAINLDWAGQSYRLFSKLRSLQTSASPDDFGPLLSELLAEGGKRQALARTLREESATYGTVDGRACERISSLVIQAAINQRRPA